jgi:hypothetical protein
MYTKFSSTGRRESLRFERDLLDFFFFFFFFKCFLKFLQVRGTKFSTCDNTGHVQILKFMSTTYYVLVGTAVYTRYTSTATLQNLYLLGLLHVMLWIFTC